MKRKIAFLAVLTICCVIISSGTLAYFTDSVQVHNIITSGEVDITLVETTTDKLDENGHPTKFENVSGVMPGMTISKIAQVSNVGESDAYVRVAVQKIITLAPGTAGTPDERLIGIDFNTTEWTYKDGFYYYNEVLKPGELTVPLFTEVTFHTSMDNLYQGSSVGIDVAAYATQVANNGNSALEAAEASWPAAN